AVSYPRFGGSSLVYVTDLRSGAGFGCVALRGSECAPLALRDASARRRLSIHEPNWGVDASTAGSPHAWNFFRNDGDDVKVLVAVKRVLDYNVKARVKSDGSGVDLANQK